MAGKTEHKQQLLEEVERIKTERFSLSDFIFQQPEAGFYEVQALVTAAKILALTVQDLIVYPTALAEIKAEFQCEKRGAAQ